MSFYGPMYGFLNGCLPIIGLGGIHLKSKYLGTLLSATSFDVDDKLFPLVFGVVGVENDESWMCFLSEIQKALKMNAENMPQVTFLSDGYSKKKTSRYFTCILYEGSHSGLAKGKSRGRRLNCCLGLMILSSWGKRGA